MNLTSNHLLSAHKLAVEARFQAERRAFLKRHRKPLLENPWRVFVIAYTLGLITVLIFG